MTVKDQSVENDILTEADVKKCEELRAEAAIYLELLEESYNKIRTACEGNDLHFLCSLSASGGFWHSVPDRSEIEGSGAWLLKQANNYAEWLEKTKEALVKIQEHAEEFADNDDPKIAELKKFIIAMTTEALIPRIF